MHIGFRQNDLFFLFFFFLLFDCSFAIYFGSASILIGHSSFIEVKIPFIVLVHDEH